MIQDFLALEPRLKDLFNSGQNRIRSYTQVLAGNNCSNNHQATHRIVEEGEEEDRISSLPDEILHSILCYLPTSKEAARTSALSRRWENLWRSYPVIEYNSTTIVGFQKFGDATMKRFSRDKLLRIEALKLTLKVDHYAFAAIRFPHVEQLIDLAWERKAEYVSIEVTSPYFHFLPFRLLSSSTVKILYLKSINFTSNRDGDDIDLLFSLNSLRFLHLESVQFDDDQLFTKLLASSPLLETLEIKAAVVSAKKLQVSHVPNLRVLKISSSSSNVKEIEIAASRLHTLQLQIEAMGKVFNMELKTPQLNVLEIYGGVKLRSSDISKVISKLDSLMSLTLIVDGKLISTEQIIHTNGWLN
ncbi:Putative FBD-associated F-box protein At5g53640 [Linum perenne]